MKLHEVREITPANNTVELAAARIENLGQIVETHNMVMQLTDRFVRRAQELYPTHMTEIELAEEQKVATEPRLLYLKINRIKEGDPSKSLILPVVRASVIQPDEDEPHMLVLDKVVFAALHPKGLLFRLGYKNKWLNPTSLVVMGGDGANIGSRYQLGVDGEEGRSFEVDTNKHYRQKDGSRVAFELLMLRIGRDLSSWKEIADGIQYTFDMSVPLRS